MLRQLLPKPKLVAIAIVVIALAAVVSLGITAMTSQGHSAALQAINDPAGPVTREIGEPETVVLIGSNSKTWTASGVTRACGANRYLVFASTGRWSWVEVGLYKPEGSWNWVAREIVLGWTARLSERC